MHAAIWHVYHVELKRRSLCIFSNNNYTCYYKIGNLVINMFYNLGQCIYLVYME